MWPTFSCRLVRGQFSLRELLSAITIICVVFALAPTRLLPGLLLLAMLGPFFMGFAFLTAVRSTWLPAVCRLFWVYACAVTVFVGGGFGFSVAVTLLAYFTMWHVFVFGARLKMFQFGDDGPAV